MKSIGDKVYTRYRKQVVDEFVIKGIAKLPQPVQIWEPTIREGSFDPSIILLERVRDGHRELWFPYWKATPATKGKLRFGQFAPKYGEDLFLHLLKDAIKKKLLTRDFLRKLHSESGSPSLILQCFSFKLYQHLCHTKQSIIRI